MRFRKALATVLPLIATSIMLTGIDVIPDGRMNWAFFPMLGMSIPMVIVLGRALLGVDAEPGRERERRRDGAAPTMTFDAAPKAAANPELERVRAYKRDIDAMAAKATNPVQRDNLKELARQVGDWCGEAERLAQRIGDFKANATVQADLQSVPVAIRKLLAQIQTEPDARVKASLERTLATRSAQWESLQKLQSTMRHAETQFESTCASLGMLYTQALAGQGTNTIADYAHLSKEVNEEAQALRDQLNALEEVKLGRADNLSR
jgi:hypothetical protein